MCRQRNHLRDSVAFGRLCRLRRLEELQLDLAHNARLGRHVAFALRLAMERLVHLRRVTVLLHGTSCWFALPESPRPRARRCEGVGP